MGLTLTGRRLDQQLAWLQDELGPAGTWLVRTTRRAPLQSRVRQEVVHGLVPHLTRATRTGTGTSEPALVLEISGPRVGDRRPGHEDDRPMIEVDHACLEISQDESVSVRQRHECWRLPGLWVEPLQQLAGEQWSEDEGSLVVGLLNGWQVARRSEIGGSRHVEPGSHREWVRAGHLVLTDHLARLDRWRTDTSASRARRDDAVVRPALALTRRVLTERGLAVPDALAERRVVSRAR